MDDYEALKRRVAELTAELTRPETTEISLTIAAMRSYQKDAERYRWLLKQDLGVWMQVGGRVYGGIDPNQSIDEAMKANP